MSRRSFEELVLQGTALTLLKPLCQAVLYFLPLQL